MLMILDLVGRAHPLVLHIPIGVLIYTYIHWMYNFVRGNKVKKADFTVPLFIAFLGTVASSISGWILAGGGGYQIETLARHKYLGIGTAVATLILLVLYKSNLKEKIFGIYFSIVMALLIGAGHNGGTLTHGERFLTKPIKPVEKEQVENLDEAHIFNDLVMPIFERKCVSCHNPNKSKGDLLFNDLAGWQKGGKNGPVLITGSPEKSAILERAHLPLVDELHMPPEGKIQLTNLELGFIKWWIKNMKDYEHKVSDLPEEPALVKFLESLQKNKFEGVELPEPIKLDKLLAHGVIAKLPSVEEPLIDVALVKGSSVSKALKKLKPYYSNIKRLDLSNSDVSDAMLKKVAKCENLKILKLNNTEISDKGVGYLSDLKSLLYLNLYKTSVTNDVFPHLKNLEKLEEVYVWQTAVSKDKADEWMLDHKDVYVDQGVDISLFGTPKLAAPKIEAREELFEDSMRITLVTNNSWADIYYSFVKNDELSEVIKYDGSFVINETTNISAYLSQEGWQNSDTVIRPFLEYGYEIVNMEISPTPSEKYPGEEKNSLINLKKGSEVFSDGRWVGFEGVDTELIVDLGDTQQVKNIVVGTLKDPNSYIFSATGIVVSTSIDGSSYQAFAKKDFGKPVPSLNGEVKNIVLDGDEVNARFIKINIEALKENPDWHAVPGAKCWLFLDEVIVG